jgi:hypothetical protein
VQAEKLSDLDFVCALLLRGPEALPNKRSTSRLLVETMQSLDSKSLLQRPAHVLDQALRLRTLGVEWTTVEMTSPKPGRTFLLFVEPLAGPEP